MIPDSVSSFLGFGDGGDKEPAAKTADKAEESGGVSSFFSGLFGSDEPTTGATSEDGSLMASSAVARPTSPETTMSSGTFNTAAKREAEDRENARAAAQPTMMTPPPATEKKSDNRGTPRTSHVDDMGLHMVNSGGLD